MITPDGHDEIEWGRAACLGVGPDIFFEQRNQDRAQALCRRCDISAECRQWGQRNETAGVWGGVSVDPPRTRTATRATGKRWYRNRTDSTCVSCGRHIEPGEPIQRDVGHPNIYCQDC